MAVSRPFSLRMAALMSRLARDRRGSASLELAIGTVAVLAVTVVAFDLYSLTRAVAATGRIAGTMADYVSRDTTPNGDDMADIGRFLHQHELDAPTALVYVISAVHQPPGGDPAVALWADDTIRIGDAAATADLVQECRNRGQQGWRDALFGGGPDRLSLASNHIVIVVEVCASLLREGMLTNRFVTGNIYRLHAVPTRDPGTPPSPPAYALEEESGELTAFLDPAATDSLRRAVTARAA